MKLHAFASRLFLLLLVFALGVGAHFVYQQTLAPKTVSKEAENRYVAFAAEVYDKILENYWDEISEKDLNNLYKLAIEKLTNSPLEKQPKNEQSSRLRTEQSSRLRTRQELVSLLEKTISNLEEEKRKEFVVNLTSAVLINLSPNGRSGLYTQKLEQQLKDTVQNIRPEVNLYQELGLDKGASSSAVEQAYNQRLAQLQKEDTPEAKEKIKQVEYSKKVLADDQAKKLYDEKGVEPTVEYRMISRDIAYLRLIKFSPTTHEEFQRAVSSFDGNKPTALIFDLRSNIGGAIDATPYFLGHFLGKNQYAYEFFKHGDYLPFKTPTDKLPAITNIKQMVILIDNKTQSSAELMAASLKKYKVGLLVGETTKGWGTVERIFPLEHQLDESEKYSIFLVHSLTLRDDGQPIEGRGVEPNVNIKNAGWEKELLSYYRYPELVEAVKSLVREGVTVN